MPATTLALRLEQQYGIAIGQLWRRVLAIVQQQYAALDADNLTAAFRAFIPAAADAIRLGQLQAQTIAGAFVQQYVETETGRAFRAVGAGDGIAGQDRTGRRLETALAGATGAVWLGLRQGRSTNEALAIGEQYVAMLASSAVADAAQREQEHQASSSRGLLKGWTWVTVGKTCPACLALQDGEVHPYPVRQRKHAGCDCQTVPGLVGVPDDVPRPTGRELFLAMSSAEQAALFKNAGEEKAALIRSGDASLADVLAHARTSRGSVVTEATLEALG